MILSELYQGELRQETIDLIFDFEKDVVVAGLGTAGAITLIICAKEGLSALGVEQLGGMGGMGTLGCITNYYYGSKGGYFEEINQKSEKNPIFNCIAESKAFELEKAAAENGADFIYETVVTGVFLEGNKVIGVRCFKQGEFINIKAKFVIDATADAFVSRLAGCRVNLGRGSDGKTQPYTNQNIIFTGVNKLAVNVDEGYIDQSDVGQYRDAMVDSAAFSPYYDKRGGAFLTYSPLLGVREGHLIEGEEKVSFKDAVLSDYEPDKPIFYPYSNVDLHTKDLVFEDEILKDWYIACGLWGLVFSAVVPLGAVVPKGFDGILVSGRALSVAHDIASCIRMKSDMEKCGEAVGQMAALAVRDGVSAMEIDYAELKSKLEETGCLDIKNRVKPTLRCDRNHGEGFVEFDYYIKVEDMIADLGTEFPGVAMWSAVRLGRGIAKELYPCLTSDNENLRKHAAFTLALLGDEAGKDVLLETIRERDSFLVRNGGKYIFTRVISAVYLVGKLRLEETKEVLFEIMEQKGVYSLENFEENELFFSKEEVFVQLFVNTAAALSQIVKTQGEKDRLMDLIQRKDLDLNISLKQNPKKMYDLKDGLIEYVNKTVS